MTRTPELSAAWLREQLELYRQMWVLRLLDMAVEEMRIDGRLNQPVQAALGQEAVAIGTAAALRPGDFMTTAIIHMQHAQQISCALPLGPAIAALSSPDFGPDGDEEAPFVASVRGLCSLSSTLQQSPLLAVGHAYGKQLMDDGGVTVCVMESRDAKSADFAEAAHIALSWQLPVVFVVENAREEANVSECHGLPVISIDGNDVAVVRDSVAGAVRCASAGGGPVLVHAMTQREDGVVWVGPLVLERERLIDAGVSAAHLYEVERRARHLVAEAEVFAKVILWDDQPAPIREPEVWPAAS
ncbi:thiamine pyrophosphate-dependent enzyme [Mycobacterium montefiorense]|uniref:thiamine pyrophosphate-dependent enzyme n=1 Tax=Mycobacterium montefiorense TaxID=154654 RepID=UPI0021DB89A3|nr:thiamine pyrophosphate-dependent enzyme [Mycobacterium montefiorense]MCV7427270.1 dehydrogenase [Mycobacterium montefiorense]GLE50530.1 dehydrogenase [Mycobacterium montefiorense]